MNQEQPNWKLGDVVLANWNGLYYKAKIIDVLDKNGVKHFRIHYDRWHKRWDQEIAELDTAEWMEFTEEAYKKAKSLVKGMKMIGSKRVHFPRKSAGDADTMQQIGNSGDNDMDVPPAPKKRRRSTTSRADEKMENSSTTEENKELGILCPGSLKQVIVDDFDKMSKLGYWPKLPAKITISQIIKEFCEMALALPEEEKEVVIEYANGKKVTLMTTKQELNAYACMMEGLFNHILFKRLLVDMEKPQIKMLFDQVQKSDEKDKLAKPFFASEFYGLPYLLRLFVNINCTSHLLNANESYSFIKNTSEFLKFLAERIDVFYDKDEYIVANQAARDQNTD